MPSPIGHALGGVIAGVAAAAALGERIAATGRRTGSLKVGSPAVGGPRGGRVRWLALWTRIPRDIRLFAWLGMAADLDFLIGRHSRETHSVGAALVVMAGLAAWTRRPRVAVAGALAYASHILLDWLGSDTVPPIGIMALWPVTTDFYQSPWFVFDAISRHVWRWQSWGHNAGAVVREVIILAPLVALAVVAGRRWRFLQP